MDASAVPGLIREKFLEGMSRAATTVSIVTTDGPAGRAGVTVSAMASVSADSAAPSLLVCVHHLSPAANAIRANQVFCVNVLRDSQAWMSDVFAGRRRTSGGDKFEAGDWESLRTGSPVLSDALVAFDCTLRLATLYGSHYLMIGELEEAVVADRGMALVYAGRAYGSAVGLGQLPASRREPALEDTGPPVAFGCFATLAPYTVPRLLAEHLRDHPDSDVHVVEGDQEQLVRRLGSGEIEFALTYDDGLPATLLRVQVAEVPPYALLPALHPLASQPVVSLADLVDEPMVLLDLPPSRTYFPSLFEECGLTPRIAYRSPSFEMVRSMVGNGFGFSLLGTKPASATAYDGTAVAARPLAEPLTPSRLCVARVRAAPLSDAAVELIALIRRRLGD